MLIQAGQAKLEQKEVTVNHGPAPFREPIDITKKYSDKWEEPLPEPWERGPGQCQEKTKITEKHLVMGAEFCQQVYRSDSLGKRVTLVDKMTEENKPADLFEDIRAAEDEVYRLHDLHTQKASSRVDWDTLLNEIAPSEKLINLLHCKAILNTPSTGKDIVGDCVLVMTALSSGPNLLRRIYFLQVTRAGFVSPYAP